MPALKLFVSHSSHFDDVEDSSLPTDHNLVLLKETCRLLRQEYGDKIEILVDKEGLEPGCDWEKRLNEWLAECHAAIILFSKRVVDLKSNWVKKEATILSWRRELEKDFTLIPVLLDGQSTPEDLEKDLFGTLRISKNQCVHSADKAQDIVNGLKKALGEPETLAIKCFKTPFDKLESIVAKLLSKDLDKETLEEAWMCLEDADKPQWSPNSNIPFSSSLARYILRDAQRCLTSFQCVLDKLHPPPDKAHAHLLLKYIRSQWVDAKAAGIIPASKHQPKITGIAMNGAFLLENNDELGTKYYTLERYIERAYLLTDLIEVIPLTDIDTEESIKREICSALFGPASHRFSSDSLDDKIKNEKSALFVFIRASEDDGGIPGRYELKKLTKLKETHSNITFVFWPGHYMPECVPNEFLPVTPMLILEQEERQYLNEIRAHKFLERRFRG